MSTDDLVAFIEARLAEDQERAERGQWTAEFLSQGGRKDPGSKRAYAKDIEREGGYSPARVLREVEAKRRIVEECKGTMEWADTLRAEGRPNDAYARHAGSLLGVLKTFATVWHEHPGFRPEWLTEEGTDG